MKNRKLLKKSFINKIFGFSIVGIIITFLSILLLFLFLKIMKMNLYIGYTLAYFLSISLSYLLNSFLVFKTRKRTVKQLFIYYLVYAISMLIGLFFLKIIESIFPNSDKFLLSLAVVPITFTWNFFFANKLLTNIRK